MPDDKPVRFTLSDKTKVLVKKVTNNKYDFELQLTNGNRKTFVWTDGSIADFIDRNGSKVSVVKEAVEEFKRLIGK